MKNWLYKRPRKKLSKTKLARLKEKYLLYMCKKACIEAASMKSSVRGIFKTYPIEDGERVDYDYLPKINERAREYKSEGVDLE